MSKIFDLISELHDNVVYWRRMLGSEIRTCRKNWYRVPLHAIAEMSPYVIKVLPFHLFGSNFVCHEQNM